MRVAANLNDPGAPRRRNALVLPAPRVSERELEEIAKLGKSGAAGADFEPGVEDTPGGTLLGEHARAPAGAGPTATPARTPSAGGHDAILREAAHLSVLSRGQTPLLGGENVSLAGSDFSGITPARRDARARGWRPGDARAEAGARADDVDAIARRSGAATARQAQ